MPKSLEFSDALFARLQSHAEPLVDSVDSVIARALDALEAGSMGAANGVKAPSRSFNPSAPPNLTHTTPKAMSLCGKAFGKGEANWNALMHEAIRAAAKCGLGSEQIHELLVVPSVIGEKTDHGYRYLEDVGISVQGQDANGAWKQAYHIANHLDLPVTVTFEWQDREAAAMPGQTGEFAVAGS